MKKSKPNPKANRNILWFVYAAVFLFLAMGIYVGYFLVVKSDTVIDNPYNARATIFEDRVTRGKILADDGTVLAKTVTATDSNGTEVREYPYRQPVCPCGRIFDGGKDRNRIPGKL